MPVLFSWALTAHSSGAIAHGVVSGHPKLPEGEVVHTSLIRHAAQMEDHIRLETLSGSVYSLPLEEIDAAAGRYTPLLQPKELPPPEELGLPPDLWERCIQARGEAALREEESLRALASPGTLRLRIVGTTALSALWAGPDGRIGRLGIGVHLGTFQDSVLIRGPYDGAPEDPRVDLRYFPYPKRMEPYHISDGIETILIVNEGVQDVSFGYGGRAVSCAAGETTRSDVGDGLERDGEG